MISLVPAFALKQTVAPNGAAISIGQAKSWARIEADFTDDDADIGRMILEASEWVEEWCDRQLLLATYQLTMPSFFEPWRHEGWSGLPHTTEWKYRRERVVSGRTIVLPRPPLVSVASVTYADTSGNSQTFSSSKYHVATAYKPGFITLKDNQDWPDTELGNPNAVVIQYTAGEADNTSVPQRIKNAIGRLVCAAYECRQPVKDITIPAEVFRLLGPYRRNECV